MYAEDVSTFHRMLLDSYSEGGTLAPNRIPDDGYIFKVWNLGDWDPILHAPGEATLSIAVVSANARVPSFPNPCPSPPLLYPILL